MRDGTPCVLGDRSGASDIVGAQRRAIERAKELNPNDRPVVERVRNAKIGGRDKWRSRK